MVHYFLIDISFEKSDSFDQFLVIITNYLSVLRFGV